MVGGWYLTAWHLTANAERAKLPNYLRVTGFQPVIYRTWEMRNAQGAKRTMDDNYPTTKLPNYHVTSYRYIVP